MCHSKIEHRKELHALQIKPIHNIQSAKNRLWMSMNVITFLFIFGTSGPVVFYFYYWPSYVSLDKWIYKVNMILIYSWNYYYFCQIAIYQTFSSTDSVSKLYPLAQPSVIIWKQIFVFINDNWHRSKVFKQSHYIFGCFKLIRKNNRILQTRETTCFALFVSLWNVFIEKIFFIDKKLALIVCFEHRQICEFWL